MSSKYLIVLLVAAAQVVVEGLVIKDSAVPSYRLFGGNDAEKGEFPHQVSIQIPNDSKDGYKHNCGGSILNSQWILTAAHCVVPEFPPTSLLVKAGKHRMEVYEKGEQSIPVQEAFIHELYTTNTIAPYDIALLKLKTPLILNKAISAVNLPKFGAKPTGNGILSGWGSISPTHMVIPKVLQKAFLPIIDYATCKAQTFPHSSNLHPTNICTSGNVISQVSACGGDSGGPLTQKKNSGAVVVGVVSWGADPCDLKGYPTMYVDVAQFIDWIKDTMKKY